jgi:hypothetical protein
MAENLIHKGLADHRVNDDREFFKITVKEAIQHVREICKELLATNLDEKSAEEIDKKNTEEIIENLINKKADILSRSKSKAKVNNSRTSRISFVEKLYFICQRCGYQYSVTLRRNEYFSICPNCYNKNAANIVWD